MESSLESQALPVAPSLEVAEESAVVTTSARKRFAFTIVTNLTRSAVSFSATMFIARSLGPSLYGNMAFLLGTFAGVRALLDVGSSSAFFTFLSQRPRSRRFVARFFAWMGVQFTLPFIVIAFVLPQPWVVRIWRGQSLGLILLALAASFLQLSVWPAVQQACESQRRTILAQSAGVVIVATHLTVALVLWRLGTLSIAAVFIALVLEYGAAAALAMSRLSFRTQDRSDENGMLSRYVRYCLPLLPLAAVSFGSEFADRWLLQSYGGGVQQAFYSVGAQIASIALIATVSILNIFWKEIAEAHHRRDFARTAFLYRRVMRLLFFVGSAIAGFLVPWAGDLLGLMLGAAYTGGAATLAIMLLYPVHQSMGQIGATMMYATERVGLQVMVSIGTVITGIATAYVVLAPPTAAIPGLGLGSTGLAIKMVSVQVLSVNVLAFVIARSFGWKFDWIFQPLALTGCVALGFAAHALTTAVMPAAIPLLVRVAACGIVYGLAIVAFLAVVPTLLGLTRGELAHELRRVRDRIRAGLTLARRAA